MDSGIKCSFEGMYQLAAKVNTFEALGVRNREKDKDKCIFGQNSDNGGQ